MSKSCQESTIIDTLARLCELLSIKVSLKPNDRKAKKKNEQNQNSEIAPDQISNSNEVNNDQNQETQETKASKKKQKKSGRNQKKNKNAKGRKKKDNPPLDYFPIPLNPLTKNAKYESTQVDEDFQFQYIEQQNKLEYSEYLNNSYELLSYLTLKKFKSRCFSKWTQKLYQSALIQKDQATKNPNSYQKENQIENFDKCLNKEENIKSLNFNSDQENPQIYKPRTLLYAIPNVQLDEVEQIFLKTNKQVKSNLTLNSKKSDENIKQLTCSEKDFYADIVLSEFS